MPMLLRLLALLLCLAAPALRAQDVLPVPTLSARVIDQTGTLDAAARDALDAKLAAFEAQAGPQIVVLMVASTLPEDISSYAQRVGDAWKIGRRAVGDGLLIVVAKNDRKVWIAPAKALEGAVPDLAARQIIQNIITPAFKKNDFAGGLSAGADALMARIKGEALPLPTDQPGRQAKPASQGIDWETLAMFFFVGVPVVGSVLTAVMGRKLGAVVTAGGTGALAGLVSSSMVLGGVAGVVALVLVGVLGLGAAGRRGGLGLPVIFGGGGGGWGGGGGGGGFSSGGGGDFGGGGAGGSW